MADVASAPPGPSRSLELFHTTDPLLSNAPVLIFHGPAASIGSTSSRIQVHVFTPAGPGSYARLAVSPNSPFYSAVANLPREEQGDEVVRGLAFGLKKYFAELSQATKARWCARAKAPSPAALFGDAHVAILASRMTKIDNVDEVMAVLEAAFHEQRQSWQDVELVLPPGSIRDHANRSDSIGSEDTSDAQLLTQTYGRYAELVASLGEPTFMPTSKLKRAPSRPLSVGRGISFTRSNKEGVRKELGELLGTEESYLDRLRELQEASRSLGVDLCPRSRDQLREVFPGTIGDILEANTKLAEELRALYERTAETAEEDLEAQPTTQTTTPQIRQYLASDAQGISAAAECLCDWLPRFADLYSSYIKTQGPASQLLRRLFRSSDPALVSQLQHAGEQKLTSLLIEPVQRLPRYTLYIDSITKHLPARHPAIKHLLRARDLVGEICAQEDLVAANIVGRLRSLVAEWPTGAHIDGRLITAIDCQELEPPYTSDTGRSTMLLLFTDSIILLEKIRSVSARGFLANLESHSPAQVIEPHAVSNHDLHFIRRVRLDALHCTETHQGHVLHLYAHLALGAAAQPPQQQVSCNVLRLEGTNDAGRVVQDIMRARLEGRFSERERESSKWEVRASTVAGDISSVMTAVYDDSNSDFVASRRGRAAVRVTLGKEEQATPETWSLTVELSDGSTRREIVSTSDSLAFLGRQAWLYYADQPAVTACLLAKRANIMDSIALKTCVGNEDLSIVDARERIRRPVSPRKMLSTFLSSTGPNVQPATLMRKELPVLPPPQSRPVSMAMKPPSRESRPASRDLATPQSVASMRSMDHLSTPYKKLEETLSTYTLALQARKGNIVGRSLKVRASADELAVNELYNSVLEDPNMMVLAAQATVDVLFAAFEKFLNIAWKEQIGQVLPYELLHDIQTKAETLFPTDFDNYFRAALSKLSPQNQRAFKGIIKLLADLLDGTGNDGDRGALTAAFAEVLVTEGDPHSFIALLDRFVDDTDTYFGEPLEEAQKNGDGVGGMHKRTRSVNSASIGSNTSSLRKKFGFGTLSRENSKSEQESKVASVWRTLSKSTRIDASPAGSILKAPLNRSISTEADSRTVPRRPSVQDAAPSLVSSAIEGAPSVINVLASSSTLGLSTIGEHPSFIPTGPPRKKRRSSLSDLKALHTSTQSISSPWMSPTPRRPVLAQTITDDKALPASPDPSTPSSRGGSGRFGSPLKETPRSRLPSSFRLESSPGASKGLNMPAPLRPRSSSKQPNEVVITSRPTSSIPTLGSKQPLPPQASSHMPPRTGLSERPGAGNIVKRPSPQPEKSSLPSITTASLGEAPSTAPMKLRVQSPQKLRDRLQDEQAAVRVAQASLQDELSKIGDELTATPSRIGSVRTPRLTTNRSTGSAPQQSTTLELTQRVLKAEALAASIADDCNSRIQSLQADLASSLAVSEGKCRKLDELYREANGENEALYARFNEELGRILKAVRGGEGVDELKSQLKERQEETAKLKREVARVRREVVGLRAQLKD